MTKPRWKLFSHWLLNLTGSVIGVSHKSSQSQPSQQVCEVQIFSLHDIYSHIGGRTSLCSVLTLARPGRRDVGVSRVALARVAEPDAVRLAPLTVGITLCRKMCVRVCVCCAQTSWIALLYRIPPFCGRLCTRTCIHVYVRARV